MLRLVKEKLMQLQTKNENGRRRGKVAFAACRPRLRRNLFGLIKLTYGAQHP